MSIRPLAAFNVQELDSVDDALALLDANIEDVMVMVKDQVHFGPKEFWILDKNILFLKSYYDQLEKLIKEEGKK